VSSGDHPSVVSAEPASGDSPARRPTYHHGNLREALVESALAILEERGLEALTLRGVAARANVSHAAPAHHFPSLRDLLTALASIGFARFAESMRAERAASTPEPAAQMRAAERGYRSFAEANPGLFRLMFTSELLDPAEPTWVAHAKDAYRHLVEICAPAADHLGLSEPGDRAELERLVWSQVHGRAHLGVDGRLPAPGADCAPATTPLDMAALIFGGQIALRGEASAEESSRLPFPARGEGGRRRRADGAS
jgi:AcrR family transcriptional regulator